MSKYYFFDSSFISEEKNTALRLATPEKATTSASWIDPMETNRRDDIPDWEYRVSILYPFVIFDEEGISVDGVSPAKYKLWYESSAIKDYDTGRRWLDYIIDKENSKGVELGDFENIAKGSISKVHPEFHFALCYMESNDGINWERPNCGEFYYKKQDGRIIGTNIVFIGEHGEGVVKNTHPLAGKGEPRYLFGCAHDGFAISASDDGIHWEKPIIVFGEHQCPVQVRCDTQNHLYWSKEAGRYVIITRGIEFDKEEPLRSVLTIPGPSRLCPEESKSSTDLSGSVGSFIYPFVTLDGPVDAQPYSMPVCRLSDGYYIGLVSMFNYDGASPDAYHVYGALAWSRDLINWKYLCPNEPFIANADEFKFERGNDYGMIYCASPITVDGKMRIYYAAIPEGHYFKYDHIPESYKKGVDIALPRAKAEKQITRTTALNYATVDIDRFVGLYSEEGVVCTKSSAVEGGIKITADILSGGSITARLLDEDGKVIEGFGYGDFSEIKASVTNENLVWRGDLRALKDKKVKIEFSLKNAVIYAYESDGAESVSADSEKLPPLIVVPK